MHGSWENTVDVQSPLHRRSFDTGDYATLNIEDSAQVWINGGCPKEKLIIGIPTYGRSFTLQNPSQTGLKSPAAGPGAAGEMSGEPGLLSYVEICLRLKKQWTRSFDSEGVVPFAFNGNQWVGYEDAESIGAKRKLIEEKGYGGGMFWAIDMDDYKGLCSSQKFPLLNALLGGPPPPTPEPTSEPPTSITTESTSDPTSTSPAPTTPSGSPSPGDDCQPEGMFSQYQPDCSQYLRCIYGKQMLMSCPSGLYWNQAVTTCDWPSNVPKDVDCVRL